MPLTRIATVPQLEPRPAESHKGDFGKLLIVAGSAGMAGAACLTATAALRSGAGLVTVAVPLGIASIIPTAQPCAMTLPLAQSDDGTLAPACADRILEFLETCDCLVLGPGMGRNPGTEELVQRLVPSLPCPTIIDADGLNNLAARMACLESVAAPVVLTPHPGEMRRLDPEGHAKERVARASSLARRWGCILLLKGHRSLVTDGRRVFLNPTGNPGMATAGSGDVLSGMIGALLGQGLDPFDAALLGAYLHGRAGDLAARALGQLSLVATDIIDQLPGAFRHHQGRKRGLPS